MPIDSCDNIKGGNVLLQCRACGESMYQHDCARVQTSLDREEYLWLVAWYGKYGLGNLWGTWVEKQLNLKAV